MDSSELFLSTTQSDLCIVEASHFMENTLCVQDKDGNEVIRVSSDGDVFWRERKIETDQAFRDAMIDMAKAITGTLT